MRWAVGIAAAILLCSGPASARERGWFPGSVGNVSCATWLSNPDQEEAGEHWIRGLWTGLNINNARDHTVGSSSDGNGIVAEVKLVCRETPSMMVVSAAMQVYRKMEATGR